MLKFKRKPGVKYYHNSTFRIKTDASKKTKKSPKPMRKISAKMRKRIKSYTQAAYARWGAKCFLCGRTISQTQLDIHHIYGRINGDDVEYMVPLCHRGIGCGAHNHLGMDARFYELKKEIESKMAKICTKQREENKCQERKTTNP